MRAWRLATVWLLALWVVLPAQGAVAIPVLTWHDVGPGVATDKYAVSRKVFARQIDTLKKNGFTPVSLATIERARKTGKGLPAKPVVLSFDDGLVSYSDIVVPLLKRYGYPSVLSVVTSWVDGKVTPAEYRGKLMGWKDLQRLSRSPLVEIVTHSHDLHHWAPPAPGGVSQPAAISRLWKDARKRRETDTEYRLRLTRDLQRSIGRFRKMLGYRPIAVTWPYGRYTEEAVQVARTLGFRMQLTLDDGRMLLEELPKVRRYMITRTTTTERFRELLGQPQDFRRQMRFVSFDLHLFGHVDAANHALLIGQMVDRITSLGANTIVITPFDVEAKQAFFRNSYYPVKVDVLQPIIRALEDGLRGYRLYLRIPHDLPPVPARFYTELARNYEFSGVLLDGKVSRSLLSTISRRVRREQPDAKIGLWRPEHPAGDISFVDHMVAAGKGTRIVVRVDGDAFLTTGGLASALRRLRKDGVMHYGFGPLNFMKGPQAPEAVVEAMGPRLVVGGVSP